MLVRQIVSQCQYQQASKTKVLRASQVGMQCYANKEYAKALEMFTIALNILLESGSAKTSEGINSLNILYYNIGSTYFAMEQYSDALAMLDKTLNICISDDRYQKAHDKLIECAKKLNKVKFPDHYSNINERMHPYLALMYNGLLSSDTLELQNEEITQYDVEVLALCLAKNKSVKILDLYNCKIGSNGTRTLAVNHTLRKINLSFNRIGDEGAIALARNKNIEVLLSDCNSITSKGASALASNDTIKKLYISGNEIDDTGAFALANNKTLLFLSIQHNKIGERGQDALIAATKENPENIRRCNQSLVLYLGKQN